MKDNYSITVLEGLEAVRKVPGMYIGPTEDGTGYHHMLMEVIDNSVDEYLAGYCNKIIITLHKDGSASVEDNGRGIPVYYMEKEKSSALEAVLTKLHAGGKFDKEAYSVSGGLHGVGISVVNALSAKLRATVFRDNKEYTIAFVKGKKVEELSSKSSRRKTGTLIRFIPDPIIFKNNNIFSFENIKIKLQELSYLCKDLTINLIDEKNKVKEIFSGNEGISDFVIFLAKSELIANPIVFSHNKNDIITEIALQWVDNSDNEICQYYTNNIPNPDGGSHAVGFKSSLTRTINNYISSSDLPKNLKVSLSGDDIREGLVAIISIRHPNPRFSSQTKEKLVSEDARTAVETAIYSHLSVYFEQNPTVAKKIIIRCVNAFKAREAARKARDTIRKSSSSSGAGVLPGKLADCQERDPDKRELFIVEGDSAGGCFSGNTKIILTDGRLLSFFELIKEYNEGKDNFCYSIEKNGNVKISLIKNPRLTKRNSEVIRLVLNNGEEIICTPNHLFMLDNGEYTEAKNIINKNLMSLYNKQIQVIKIFKEDEKTDVYDMEITEIHNFALSSGIFVHNSAKQGRDRKFQAILPLRGKVLNVEKAEFRKMIANEELTALVTAIGVGIGKLLNPDLIRYKKIIIMSVDGDEPVCIKDSNGFSKIVRFKDVNNISETLTMDEKGTSKFSKVDMIIKHKLDVPLFKITTDYGRTVVVTGNHSIFVNRNGNPELILASSIKNDDELYVGIPKLSENLPEKINIFEFLWNRKNDENCSNLIIKGPNIEDTPLQDFTLEEIQSLNKNSIIADKFSNDEFLPKWFYLSKDFFFFLGYWLAKGFCGETSIGKDKFISFEEFTKYSNFKSSYNINFDIFKIINKTFRIFFSLLIGGIKTPSYREIPQIVFSASNINKLEFLSGYFLGNGTISKLGNISFYMSNYFMARQLLWLLGNFEIFPNMDGNNINIYGDDLTKIKLVWERHKNANYLNRIYLHKEVPKFGERTYLVKVKNIEKLEKLPEFVYDFSVPETQRFFCGDGILCHNTDSDVDGAHIRTLLLTFFFRQMPQLILNGNLFIAVPPLYRIITRGNSYYLKDDTELKKFIKDKNLNRDKLNLQRFKGLGEMNPQQLWDTAMNPISRKLLQVVIDNYLEADRLFNMLMGMQVDVRRDFIIERALFAKADI